MNKEEIGAEIKRLSKDQPWNHQFYLPYGLKTRDIDIDSPGYNINKWPRLSPIFEKLLGENCKSVLDVGCSDGYYSIQIARENPKTSVLGIDLDNIRIERSNFIKRLAEVENCHFDTLDLYDLITKKTKYDIVMGLGLLHRVPDLDKCIDDLCTLSRHYVVFEFKTYKTEESSYIDRSGKTKSNTLNGLYKIPSISYVEERLQKNGFKMHTLLEDDSSLNYPRTILVGKNE
tara:strand:- start:95 stop:787 length:693 start_codon:yes stop_codon:yes gene_type:complete